MNERIRELAAQAGFIGESMYPIFGTTQETALKNFAELIVSECMRVADEYQNRGGNCYVDNMIAKHFGVE